MLTTRWLAGPQPRGDGPVVVSETGFQLTRAVDLPGACWAGWRLSRLWPELEGAIALRLWVDPRALRLGSVSVWRGRADLDRFVRLRAHADVVRAYRGRGTLTSATWESEQWGLPEGEVSISG